MRYKDKTLLMVDNGLFVEFAVMLAQNFGRVYYYMPWESAFPRSNERLVGTGIPGVERVQSIWEVYDEVDLFMFPDVYFGHLQAFIAGQGKRVWGSRTGEFLELDRVQSKERCKAVGIDIGPYVKINGISKLRAFLQKHKDQFVKISTTRGDMETFHSLNYDLIEPKLDELEWLLGAKKESMEFIVEEALNDAIETGYDGFTIDGEFPDNSMFGIEIKDRGYVIEACRYSDLPATVRDVNSKLSSILKEHQYRGFISTEIRVKGDKGYLIDPCCRAGVPPNELLQLLVTNWDEIIWEGSSGKVIEPKFADRFGAELILASQWADKNWQPIKFPEAFRPYVKLHNLAIIQGRYYTVPQNANVPYVGGAVAISDTMEDAIAKVRRYTSKIEGYYLEVHEECLDEALTEFNKLKTLR